MKKARWKRGGETSQGAKASCGIEGDNPSRRNPTPRKKRTAGTKLARSLARPPAPGCTLARSSPKRVERFFQELAYVRRSTTPSLNVATQPAKRKKTHGREKGEREREGEQRAAAEKKESHSPRREKEKRGTRSGPLTLNRTVRRF